MRKDPSRILIVLTLLLIASSTIQGMDLPPEKPYADKHSIGGLTLTPVEAVYTGLGPAIIWRLHRDYYIETVKGTYRLSGYGDLIDIVVRGSRLYYARISPISNTTVIAGTDLLQKQQPWRIEFKPMLNPVKIEYVSNDLLRIYGVEFRGDKSLLYTADIDTRDISIRNASLIDLGSIRVKKITILNGEPILLSSDNKLYFLRKMNRYSLQRIILQVDGEQLYFKDLVKSSRKTSEVFMYGSTSSGNYIVSIHYSRGKLGFNTYRVSDGRILYYDPLNNFYLYIDDEDRYGLSLNNRSLKIVGIDNAILFRDTLIIVVDDVNIYIPIKELTSITNNTGKLVILADREKPILLKAVRDTGIREVESSYAYEIMGSYVKIATLIKGRSVKETYTVYKAESNIVELYIGAPKLDVRIEHGRANEEFRIIVKTYVIVDDSYNPVNGQDITLLIAGEKLWNTTRRNGQAIFKIYLSKTGRYEYSIRWDNVIEYHGVLDITPTNTTTYSKPAEEEHGLPLVIEILIGVLTALIIAIILIYLKYMKE